MKKKDIKFLEIRHLNGPNIWTYRPVLEAIVDIGELEDSPSNTIPGFYERLRAWLPSLIEHRCSYEERGGFLRRVEEGTWPGHILEHVTLELQNLAGMPGGFGKARETPIRGVYKVVVRAWHEEVTRAALFAARELILAAMDDLPYDVEATLENLRDMGDSLCLGPSTACIVDAADDRDIPAIRLLSKANLVQIGYGAKSRRIWTAETDRTSAIAETISRDKDLTKSLLQSCGVPVPEGRMVDSPEDAWEAAEDIGLPVVVKPYDGNHGRGVFIELTRREEVESAYRIALDEGSGVLVERCIPGTEHRLLVVGGRLVAANRGDMVWVSGDGKQTINELIASQINSDPRRGMTEDHPLNVIRIDSAARMEITRQGFTPDSVPPAGQDVLIQRNGNHAFDVTDEVHPTIAAAASLAARIVGLDIAGIDLVCEDISRPLAEQGGAIVEVNAGPGLLMHIKPAVGTPRPVGRAIVDHLFPQDNDGRIPVVGITGSYGKTALARIVAHLLVPSGKTTGLACSDGLFLDRRQVEKGDCANWGAAHRTLKNRSAEAAVFENGSDTILGDGLAYDRCQVGVVTNVDPQKHLGRFYVDDPDKVFSILRTQIDVVLPSGAAVLNAADPLCVAMAPLCDGDVIYFASEGGSEVLAAHRAEGKRAVLMQDGNIILATGSEQSVLMPYDAAPLASGPAHHADNVLAAVGTAWALGLTPELIRTGIETFTLA
ncbi:MAG: cyanophycin synthetase [Rhodocyclaceae bacterium]